MKSSASQTYLVRIHVARAPRILQATICFLSPSLSFSLCVSWWIALSTARSLRKTVAAEQRQRSRLRRVKKKRKRKEGGGWRGLTHLLPPILDHWIKIRRWRKTPRMFPWRIVRTVGAWPVTHRVWFLSSYLLRGFFSFVYVRMIGVCPCEWMVERAVWFHFIFLATRLLIHGPRADTW
jgi:hypothetical protein